VVSEAGLTPVVVDVDAFAVQNSFEVNYELPKNETSCWSTRRERLQHQRAGNG